MLQPKDADCLNGYKNNTLIYAIYETHFRPRDMYRLKVRGWKKTSYASGNQKESQSTHPLIRKKQALK